MAYIGRTTDGFGVRQRFVFTPNAGTTSISGNDVSGATLTFSDSVYMDVFLNGVLLKAGTDYNTNTANTIAGLTATVANDEVTVLVYDIFTTADMVSATSGGTFTGNVNFSGNIDVDGTANLDAVDIDGALTQDGGAVFNEDSADVDFRVESNGDANMLFVEGETNMIGVKTNDPKEVLDVRGAIVASGDHATNSNAQGSAHGVMLSSTSGTGLVSPISNGANDVDLTLRGLNGGSFENRLVLDSDGDVTVSAGDLIFATAGKGINLGVTSNTDSNTLDDYEEGTWTPVVADANSGGNTGSYSSGGSAGNRYIKVGRLVYITCELFDINTSGMTGGNVLYIRGLPFSGHSSGTYNVGAVHINVVTHNSGIGSYYSFMDSNAYFRIFETGTNDAGHNSIKIEDLNSTNSDIVATLMYFSA